jgi:3-dehydroquinate dehydratase
MSSLPLPLRGDSAVATDTSGMYHGMGYLNYHLGMRVLTRT